MKLFLFELIADRGYWIGLGPHRCCVERSVETGFTGRTHRRNLRKIRFHERVMPVRVREGLAEGCEGHWPDGWELRHGSLSIVLQAHLNAHEEF